MKKTFQAKNINCSNCANLIKNSLEDDFGTIEVNLSLTPREVTLEITDDAKEKIFKEEMAAIGFEVIEQ
ncbi:MAG: heavy-metal-associated domain-containing protein [Sulfurospirillum sp.]|nr:heavy-metal-associated domain-containing protein [Sulfurospirillum sp.]